MGRTAPSANESRLWKLVFVLIAGTYVGNKTGVIPSVNDESISTQAIIDKLDRLNEKADDIKAETGTLRRRVDAAEDLVIRKLGMGGEFDKNHQMYMAELKSIREIVERVEREQAGQ